MPFPLMMDVCGPTTVHLRHEGYLLISLGILTLATFQSVYGEEFGTPGDYIFIFLSVLWLSRYILVRWMCTWDPSTSANPVSFFCTIFISWHFINLTRHLFFLSEYSIGLYTLDYVVLYCWTVLRSALTYILARTIHMESCLGPGHFPLSEIPRKE